MKIHPIAKYLVLKMVEPEAKTKSGLYIPETAKEDKTPMMAEVVEVGTSPKIKERGIAIGDWVIYSKYAGTEIELEGEKFMIIAINEILAKVTK